MSNSFDDWWNGLVGFHLNSERAFEEIDPVNAKRLEPWMKACWNAAIEAVESNTWEFYWKNEKPGEDLDYLLEKLKIK